MRVIFLYVEIKASPDRKWRPDLLATNYYASRVLEEGYYYMLKRMVKEKVIDELVVVIESGIGQGYIRYENNIHGWVIPDITKLPLLIKNNDVIFVRGGFKRWYKTLVKIRENNNWMLLYAANTGRERWPIFDIIFNDLSGNNMFDARGIFQFDFKKPVNPEIFFPIDLEPKYDLCIGGSYIHDKKGQWRVIEALFKYKEIFGENLKCIMPGAIRRGVKTNLAMSRLRDGKLEVALPGMISRKSLNRIYNYSKLFAHLGGGGQGDRGPLEAMSVGTPLIVGNTTRHSRVIYKNTNSSFVVPASANAEAIARTLYYLNNSYSSSIREQTYKYYEKEAGIESIIIPEMKKLFRILGRFSRNDIKALCTRFPLNKDCLMSAV